MSKSALDWTLRVIVWLAGAVSVALGLPPLPAVAQLNENCVVSVLNRNVQAKADGTWVLPNIPANFGELRARATCVQGGVTTYGESAPFTIPANGSTDLPPITIGPTTSIPTAVRVSSPAATLATIGATAQLSVLANFPGGAQGVDITRAASTRYTVSNPAIATVSAAGLVTAVRSGIVIVQATNEGTQGITSLRVALAGADSDGDGIPDEEEVRLGLNPNNGADALLDADHDGLTALQEYRLGTDPTNPDTDGDGLSDGDEANCVRGGFCTNPLLADTDGDGVRDLTEITTGSDPTNAASINLSAALASLRATPASFTLVVNSLTGTASVQLTVIGTLIDGFELNLTSTARQTTYSSSNLGSCNFGAPDGRVFASSAGSCQITVRNNGRSTVVQGTVQDFAPEAVSFVAIPGFANGVAVSGDYAFVASGATGMQVVSLGADRRSPAIIAALNVGAASNDITLAGNFAYLATASGLKVVDVSTPTAPRLLGSFGAVGNAMGVKVRGTTAYIVGGSTLYIVSVANPAAMIQAGSLSLGGQAWNLDLDPTRGLAAVAMGSAGLKLVDVSNLSAPVLRGTASTGDARGVALRGNTAIVADYANSMTAVDVANLASPVIRSRTPTNLGGLLTNVVLSDNFALGADVFFVNGVPIVDITNDAAIAPRAVLNFPARDDNGMGIAVDNAFIYVVTDRSSLQRGGSSGDGRLYIGQYQPRVDLAGVPPTATITSPINGTRVYEGAPLTILVDAMDDVAVAAVVFSVGGSSVFTSTTAPYQYTLTVPSGVGSLTLGAAARDLGGNEAAAQTVTVSVAPDPLTRVVGAVVDSNGNRLPGTTVTAPGGRTGTSGQDGRFEIIGVPTVLGNLVVQAQYQPPNGVMRTGSSAPVAPVVGATTDVGTITVIDVAFETNYGERWTTCDDCNTLRILPFSFPFYGAARTTGYVSTNGYITFDQGDSEYTESVPRFTSLPRISAFFDDLIGGGGVFINNALPDRFIVTYDRTQHFSAGGSNTLQIQLFRDGRIVFGYQGITALTNGTIVGLTPGPNAPFLQVDFNGTPGINVPPNTAVYEYFTGASPFDLDQSFVVFTPAAGGGYTVRTIGSAAVAPSSALTGAVGAETAPQSAVAQARSAAVQGKATARALTPADIANAEVLILSSGNPRFRGMTNTDGLGRFSLQGIPAGGISVEVRRRGVLLARGAGVFTGGNLNQAHLLNIELQPAEVVPKNRPATGTTR